jgi:regulatory protein
MDSRVKLASLTPSEKDPSKFCAAFEDGKKLTVTVALIADYSLFSGRELDSDEYAALLSAAAAAKTKARALRLIGKRNMSRREITERLVMKGETEESAEETAEWLEKIGAVNDEEYAALIVRHYAARGFGKVRIRDELYRRGIGRELWEAALEELPEADDKLDALLRARLAGGVPDKAALKRASDALYRRGFSWDEIKEAVGRYLSGLGEYTEND